MKTNFETIKIEMSFEDGTELREQLILMINDLKGMSESLTGYFDEANLRETYHKVNEFLNAINISDKQLPF